jgi:hypothetical protein
MELDENNERFSFTDETFEDKILQIVSEKDVIGFGEYLNHLPISFENEIEVNQLYRFLRKMKGDEYKVLLELLTEVKIENKFFVSIVAKALFKILKHGDKDELFLFTIKFVLHFVDLKLFKQMYVDTIVKLIVKKSKEVQGEFIKLVQENRKKLIYVYLIGNLLKFDIVGKKELEKIFVDYYLDEVLVDEDRDKHLYKQRLLNKCLKYLNPSTVFDKVIPGCENLLLRSFQNYKFLENVLVGYEKGLEDKFISRLLTRFEGFFFNEKTFDSANLAFQKICEYSPNARVLLDELLSMDFQADKVDLNINICFYLNYLLKSKTTFTKSELIRVTNFILKALENQNEKNKQTFEGVLEMLIANLLNLEPIESTLSKEIDIDFGTIKKIITSGSFSYFYQYMYLLMTCMVEKCGVSFLKYIYENLFNNLNSLTLSASNFKSSLALISFCCTLARNEDIFASFKKNINNIIQQLINQDNLKLFNSISLFDFINIANSFGVITSDKSFLEYFEEDLPGLSKLLSCVLFKKDKKDFETKHFVKIINNIIDKSILDNLINNIFTYILNNPKGLYFHKIRVILDKYCEYYNNFTEHDFIKFIIISHIPGINNNVTENKIAKNGYLNDLYKKYHKLELNNDIIVLLEENYETLSKFIFSNLGLLNKNNNYLSESSLNIVNKMFTNTHLAACVIKSLVSYLDVRKLLFIDDVIKFYAKDVEYISFYDLAYLTETLQNVEKEYGLAFTGKKLEVVTQSQNIKKSAGKNQSGKNVKAIKATQPQEKVDKDTKLIEYKSYIEKFLVNIALHSNFIIRQLNGVFKLANAEMHRFNLQTLLKHLWKLLKVQHINTNLRTYIHELMMANNILNQFSNELPVLMHMQANPSDFHNTIEVHPSSVINFNEKLEKLLLIPDETIHKLFERFDFLVIKILYYIILNSQISNEDKTSSVNILIKIIKNLNQNILNFREISILCNSLLKTSYNAENLSVLLEIFLQNCKEEHFLSLCEDILDYEYIAKVSFLEQILALNLQSLRKYRNLVYKIWILIFDENDNISTLSLNIWNTFQLYLDSHFVQSTEFTLAFDQHRLAYSVNSAIRAYSFIIPKECKNIFLKYQEFYEKELDSEDDSLKSRILLFDYINETIELFTADMKKSVLDFIMKISDKETDEELFELMNNTIYNIIKNIEDENLFEDILNSVENNIKANTNKIAKDINSKNLKILLMTLNSVLRKNDDYEKTVIKKSTSELLFSSLFNLAEKMSNYDILYLISTCFQYLAKDNKEKANDIVASTITKFKGESKSLLNLGHLYVIAGLIKYFGINLYRQMNIHEMLLDNMKKNKSSIEKLNAVILIRVFSDAQKRLYEPFLVTLFDGICELIADKDDKVRETTQNAIKSFMKVLSGYGVKIIMPRLIKDLHTMNWRNKIVNIEILGQFAFCAPKQLSIYIPKVIKEIMVVFRDPHEKVQETAIAVLKDISSVIKNPEIVDLSDLLINAVSNPFEHSKNALTALLETTFKHAIDPPGLALVIPIIDYNLKTQNEDLKKKAAHVIGSIANLVKNPVDIYQYIDIILPSLKTALFDAIPECRNATAKAIGALTKNLGVTYLSEILEWIKIYLESDSETVQKSGAAQAYAEILESFGETFIDRQLPSIISKVQEGNNIVKEGYLSIFVFLPGCLQERFEKYFDLIFPLIIEGFSDDHENVRNVSNKIFEICIKL